MFVFGGYNIDKKFGSYAGDTVYFNDVWWLRMNMDTIKNGIQGLGMLWLGPLTLEGKAPSPRAYHSCIKVLYGKEREEVLLVFGGYDGTGDGGYKNDMTF